MNRVTIIVENRRSWLWTVLGLLFLLGVIGSLLSPGSDDSKLPSQDESQPELPSPRVDQPDQSTPGINPSSGSEGPAVVTGSTAGQQEPQLELRRYIKQQIQADRIPGQKISFDIVLHEKPTEPELRSLATSLIGEYRRDYDRVFIVYYLPDMVIDQGGWAISHYRSDSSEMEFRILGSSREAEESLRVVEIPRAWNVFGRWMDVRKQSGMLTLFRAEGRLQLEVRHPDNSVGICRLKPIKSNGLDGFEEIDSVNKDNPRRWLITLNGDLQQLDDGDAFGDPLPPFLTSDHVKYRLWQDASAMFNVEAEFIKAEGAVVTLKRRDDGSAIMVPVEDLSLTDRQWLSSEEKKQTVQYKIEPSVD